MERKLQVRKCINCKQPFKGNKAKYTSDCKCTRKDMILNSRTAPKKGNRALSTLPTGWFKIADSSIPAAGKGLFTTQALVKTTQLGAYGGRKTSRAEMKALLADPATSHHGSYTVRAGNDCFIDGTNVKDATYLRYVNHSKEKQNCKIISYDNKSVYFILTQDVAENCELYADYGRSFPWDSTVRQPPAKQGDCTAELRELSCR